MGTYLNPGNSGFAEIVSDDYIDKTGMIDLINRKINKPKKLICISRPRRFGKSYAAQMLCAYYDHTCNSHSLFDDKEVAKTEHYENCINKFNVIYLDISGVVSKMNTSDIPLRNVAMRIKELINQEIQNNFPDIPYYEDVSDAILAVTAKTKKKFVVIIDEWDAVIREAKEDTAAQRAYLDLLREWFKNGNFTSQAVAVAYMTGIYGS